MGLDVGVVKIRYLERPVGAIYDFLWTLATEPDPADWGWSWEGNAFIETFREHMFTRAASYAAEHNLTNEETQALDSWIENLPWDGDTIMLHLGW